MGYLTAKQFSEKWGISERRIIKLCKEERIMGAMKNGMVWVIPEDTIKPSDKRSSISKYINTQKRIFIANIHNPIAFQLVPLLKKEGYIVEGSSPREVKEHKELFSDIKVWKIKIEEKKAFEQLLLETEKYYDGLIYIDTEEVSPCALKNKQWFIKEFAQKMNCESAIILVNNLENKDTKLEVKLANELREKIGLRINALNIEAPLQKQIWINYKEIAEDVLELLVNFKNSTGMSVTTDGGCVVFEKDGRTRPLEIGVFYKALNSYFNDLQKGSYMWSASTMLEDEWTEEPAEMNFRVINLEAANRGANLERIFLFPKSKIKEFKKNKTLKIYMQSNITTMFVDYDEIRKKEPEILEIIGNGWDGFDTDTLIVDLPDGAEGRGYISINKQEVQKAYNCFQKLKKYAKDLKEILK